MQCNVGTLYLLSTSKNKPEALRVLEAFMQPNNLKGYYMAAPHCEPVLKVHFTDADILSRPYTKNDGVLTEPITTYGPKHPLLTEMYPRGSGACSGDSRPNSHRVGAGRGGTSDERSHC